VSKKQWHQPEASWKPLRTPVSITLDPDGDHRIASVLARRWRKRFDDEISARKCFLYARIGSESALFERLKPAVARYLEITDWENGTAVARDKTQYFEIHVQRCEVAILSILSANSTTGSRVNSKGAKPEPQPDWSPLRIILPLWTNWQSSTRQELLRRLKTALDNHVLNDEIAIFARPAADAPFKRLPADVLPILKIVDWEKGVAVGPDGTYWWSIHIQILVDQKTEPMTAATARDESAAIKALGAHLKKNNKLTRAEAITWCVDNKFTPSGRGFQSRVWPQARVIANLSAKAPSGRKSSR
jgi:hypothetical protein